MIPNEKSAFGLNLLIRVHGSAAYRSILPALVGVLLLWLMRKKVGPELEEGRGPTTQVLDPNVIIVVVNGITFLIVFRAAQGYARYWEATTGIYGMMSKWMEATIQTASYHMQANRYDDIKPPCFNDFHYLNAFHLSRDRERIRRRAIPKNKSNGGDSKVLAGCQSGAATKSGNAIDRNGTSFKPGSWANFAQRFMASPGYYSDESCMHFSKVSSLLTGPSRLDGNWGPLFSGEEKTATFHDPDEPDKVDGFASTQGGRTPALFLQELAHLSSLLVAVAFATLRNDIDGAESPLDYYLPGSPWPDVDAGQVAYLYENRYHRMWSTFLSFIGRGRTPMERTRYNALRPLPVLGGVSDAEIRFLQMARGPFAKTQLCFHWLSEFIVREHLAGSVGTVGPPIIAQTMQPLDDGMFNYNQCRKIMSIPFPFVHAQLSAFFVIIMVGVIPFLMAQYCEDAWSASLLTFLGVWCLSGVDEVARELENPFRNVPNELPVVTLMAEYNETLLTAFSGYQVDAFWETPDMELETPSQSSTSTAVEFETTTSIQSRVSEASKNSIAPDLNECSQAGIATSQGADDEGSYSEKAVDSLRSVVLEQGKIMIQMMHEQAKLDKSFEETLQHKTKLM